MRGPATVPPANTIASDRTPDEAAVERLRAGVRQLRRGTALVVGDAMLDRYLFGTVQRISPEAPVPVLSIEREVALPGGAGNVVRNLTALGAPVAFVSVVGDDPAGSDLTGLVGGQPGVEPWLLVQGGRATTTKTRFLSRGQQILRADREELEPIHPRLADRLVRIAQDAVAATAVMVLSDYRKGLLAGDTAARLVAAARAAGRKVVADFRGGDAARLAEVDLVITDHASLAAATGMAARSAEETALAATALRAAQRLGAVLVLDEHGGGLLASADGSAPTLLPSSAAEVLDTAGAADTALAIAAAALGAGLPVLVAAELAVLGAGIALGKSGIAVVREEDFEETLAPGHLARRKLASRPQAAEQVERWRRGGWRVGFVAGSAPPALLAEARGWCDRLVVGVPESDADAARFAHHASVDLVARFGAEGPIELIRLLRPDVLVQDAERAPETVAGGQLLQEWGGEVRRASLSRL